MENIGQNDPRLSGIPKGCVIPKNKASWKVLIRKVQEGRMTTVFSRVLNAKDYGNNRDLAFLAAKEMLQRESDERGLTRNKIIVLPNGDLEMELGRGYKMRFSPEKLDLVRQYVWNAANYGPSLIYAKASIPPAPIYCHRLLTNAAEGEFVDHIRGSLLSDGVTLDNTMSNLRVVDSRVNSTNRRMSIQNKSGTVGVSVVKGRKGTIRAYAATWRDENGKRHAKEFSVRMLGPENALTCAVRYRHEREDVLGIESRRRALASTENEIHGLKRKRGNETLESGSPSKRPRIGFD